MNPSSITTPQPALVRRKRRWQKWCLLVFLGPLGLLLVALHGVAFLFSLHDGKMAPVATVLRTNWEGGTLRWYERRAPDAEWDIIFIHGTPASAAIWSEQFRAPFPRANLRALDRPGFGGSRPGSRRPKLDEQAAAVGAVLPPEESNRRTLLVGHSYGAPVALAAALRFANRISGVLLIGASVDPRWEESFLAQRVADWPLVSWLMPRALRQCNRELLTLRGDLLALEPELARLRVPVVMLHGGRDTQVPAANVDYLRARFAATGRAGSFEALLHPDFNHFIPWEQPAAVEAALRALTDRVEAAADAPARSGR